MGFGCCRACARFGRSLRDLFDNCASRPGRPLVNRGFWKGLGAFIGFPSRIPEGSVLHAALLDFVMPSVSILRGLTAVGRSTDDSVQHEGEGQATREEFGRRSVRPSIRPLLIDGALPALGSVAEASICRPPFLGGQVPSFNYFLLPEALVGSLEYGIQPAPSGYICTLFIPMTPPD